MQLTIASPLKIASRLNLNLITSQIDSDQYEQVDPPQLVNHKTFISHSY